MMKFIRIFLLILIILGIALLITYKTWVPRLVEYIISRDNTSVQTQSKNNFESNIKVEYVSYKSSEYSPEFVYPKSWGEVSIIKGNETCPEEDTYRTADSLSVFDWEYSFPEMKLPQSESMIRTGIRIHEIDPKNKNDCSDEFLFKLANKEIDPTIISSVMLQPLTIASGLSGIYTPEASRLNTESRKLYTFFVTKDGRYYILQSYMSFIPYFDSPELKEMELKFSGDMKKYLEQGNTAKNIRDKFEEFKKMSESIKFTVE